MEMRALDRKLNCKAGLGVGVGSLGRRVCVHREREREREGEGMMMMPTSASAVGGQACLGAAEHAAASAATSGSGGMRSTVWHSEKGRERK